MKSAHVLIHVTFTIASIVAFTALAAPAPATTRAEIDALLDKLESSGCQFNRNGTWHNAAEAKTHLLRKLEYLEDKDAVQSTEQFIALAASKSSSSGKPYSVKCGGAAPIVSQTWLNRELEALRASGSLRQTK
ncbi:MAG TPA: DUF5329 family protein [Burkholderiales bacterium]|nr:DUF5329 family protein [Burkholderiales bacterium]